MNKKGTVLILTYLVIFVLLILSATIMQKAISEANIAKREKLYTEALYLADGSLEQICYTLAYNIANHIAEPNSSADTNPISFTSLLQNTGFNITYTCQPIESIDTTLTDSVGITTYIRHYRVSATASHGQYDIAVTVNRIITRKKTYTFQHAVFYKDDLEILPGPNMTISGKIHGNKDIYIASQNSGNVFTIDSDYLYSAGNIYNKRKDSASSMPGAVNIKLNGQSAYARMKETGESSPLDSRRADWIDGSQTRWLGTAKSSAHGVNSLSAPAVGSILPDGYFAQNAAIIIRNGTAYNSSGSPISLPSGTISESTFRNYREGKDITVTNVDMSKLGSSGNFPSNGLLYATRADSSASQPNGIRIVNGNQLAGALTVVSNNPVYIKGDYNTNSKKPSAVICDSINILSNSWIDTNINYSNRNASDTQINAAFIAGVDTTVPGQYNGGLENYPRLLEKWSNKNLKIRGSFVELWNSQIAQGTWVYGSPYYDAPKRDWNYDTDFNNPSNLPPFTPFAVETESVAWWKS